MNKLGRLALAVGFFAVVPVNETFAQATVVHSATGHDISISANGYGAVAKGYSIGNSRNLTGTAAAGSVCVYLEPGAWYVAHFNVTSGQFTSPNSGDFTIGQYRCISTEGIADGAKFRVNVTAVAGSTTQCTDLDRSPDFVKVAGNPYPLMLFAAKGTTLDHGCYLPN